MKNDFKIGDIVLIVNKTYEYSKEKMLSDNKQQISNIFKYPSIEYPLYVYTVGNIRETIYLINHNFYLKSDLLLY